jgi:WD40 repeat protein
LESGEVGSSAGHDSAAVAAAFSRESRSAATGGRDHRIQMWHVRRRTRHETFTGHMAQIAGLTFSRDGRTLYSAGADRKALIWDLTGNRRLGRPTGYYPMIARSVSLSADGRTMAVRIGVGAPVGVEIVDVATLRRRTRLPDSETVLAAVQFAPDGRYVAPAGGPDRRRDVHGREPGRRDTRRRRQRPRDPVVRRASTAADRPSAGRGPQPRGRAAVQA